MTKSTVVERQWHPWRGIKRERLNLFDCRLTLGWVTILIWRYEGALQSRLGVVEDKLKAAIRAAGEGR